MSGGRWTDSVLAFFEAVSTQHRMPMDSKRMIKGVDDFNSTWPACIAAKAASLQGARADRQYLRALREAWCLDARPIHRLEVQTDVARETGLDVEAFSKALEEGSEEQALQRDSEECERIEVRRLQSYANVRGVVTV